MGLWLYVATSLQAEAPTCAIVTWDLVTDMGSRNRVGGILHKNMVLWPSPYVSFQSSLSLSNILLQRASDNIARPHVYRRALEIRGDTKRIISALWDTTIRGWEVVGGEKCTGVLTGPHQHNSKPCVDCQRRYPRLGSHDGTACVWRITDDGVVCLPTLQGHGGWHPFADGE